MASVICKSGIQQNGWKMVKKQEQPYQLGKKMGYYRIDYILFNHFK